MIKDVKYQGHTATPSDYECMDGELAGCYNLIPEDGALHPIMPPTIKFSLNEGEQLLWLHQMTGHTHYIIMVTTTSNNVTTHSLAWVCEENADAVGENPWTRHYIDDSTITGTPTISSIGNTLIVNDDNGLRYYLWRPADTDYQPLGQKPPMLEITFGLQSDFAVWPKTKNAGGAPNQFRGAYIDVGRISDTGYFPKLGTESGWQEGAWVSPRPQMAAATGDSAYVQRVRRFANEYFTYSIEGMGNSTSESADNDMAKLRSNFTQGVLAAINKFVNGLGTEENKFVMPFFIRYAYRLYDGSYIMHSYPVLMVPNSRGPVFVLDGAAGLMLADYNGETIGVNMRGRAYGFLSTLVYSIASIPEKLQDWKDIITSVDIGVSAPIYTYDQAGSVYGWTNMDGTDALQKTENVYDPVLQEAYAKSMWNEYYSISKVTKRAGEDIQSPQWAGRVKFFDEFKELAEATMNTAPSLDDVDYGDYFQPYFLSGPTLYGYWPSYIATLPLRNIGEVSKDLAETANFYVIKKFSLDELDTAEEAELEFDKGALEGLLGRNTLDDDFHTHDHLKASLIYNYNGRINYAQAERTPHSPLNPSILFTQRGDFGDGGDVTLTVKLKDEKREIVVLSDTGKVDFPVTLKGEPLWIYYPDANATEAFVTLQSSIISKKYRFKLTPHTLLNGAYWIGNLYHPNDGEYEISANIPSPAIGTINDTNKIYTTNVNNPFFIPVTGINTVGTGKILGICSATKALSQGQFGQFPLYAFTTEGVWALETSSTGSFIARQPVARDVCTNPDSITQLDDSVIFATDKGIMLLSGSTTQCITDAINSEFPFKFSDLFTTTAAMTQWTTFLTNNGYSTSGLTQVPFSQFLSGCRMIYDYVHQRIIIYNTSQDYAYIYSLKDNKWGMMETDIDYGINSYPEALAVTDDKKVVNLSQEILYQTVDNAQVPVDVKAILVTRPLKLDQPDALKTIDTIIQRGKFNFLDSSRTVKPIRSILFGSRDLYNWHLVSSSTDHYLRGFSGTPYKYFRIVALVDFLPDESVYGATIQYNPRYMNRPR